MYPLGGHPEWERSTEALARLVIEATGRDASLLKLEARDDFTTKKKKVDSSLAVKELGHDPRTPPEVGIPRTVDWLKNEYEFPNQEPHVRARARV